MNQCLPINKGSGSCRGTSKNNGFNVNCGDLYCAKRIFGSIGPLTVPVLADLLTHVFRDRNKLKSSTAPCCVARKLQILK